MKCRSAAVTDWIVEGDESVVMINDRVMHLSALPTAILSAAGDWTDLSELVAVLEQKFGPAPNGENPMLATERYVRELEDQGLVECD